MTVDLSSLIRSPVLLAPSAIGAACCLLVVVDPATGIYPPCPSQALLGLDCPACGGLRATSALLHGDLASFADHNLLLVVVFPLLIAWWVVTALRAAGKAPAISLTRQQQRIAVGVGVAVISVFTLIRNFVPYLGSGIG